MKLRNKKTGEIIEAESCNSTTGMIGIFYLEKDGSVGTKDCFETLAELNEEWEDYKPDKPKRYRLLKDLPTFEAGDEFYIAHTGALWYDGGGDDYEDDVCAYSTQTLMKFPNILEEWFEEIKPADPLIKDEKIRKAVRAWAEAVGTECVEITTSRLHIIKLASYISDEDKLCISREIGQVFDEKLYTIAELCGEDEENGRDN